MKIGNIGRVPEEFVRTYAKGECTKLLGQAGGSRKIYVNIDTLPPGTYSAKYHSHTRQEEFFLILHGTGTLRLNGEERAIGEGDFIAKRSGEGNAHQFYNSGSAPLEILDIGTVETGDIAYYPDEKIYLLRDERLAFRQGDARKEWSSDPDDEESGQS